MSLFEPEQTEQDRINEYAMSRLISAGTGFVDGKFRIVEYFSDEHNKAEKVKFLSNEYGWGGSYCDGEEFETRPGKGITMRHIDKEHPENDITVHLTYKEAADMIDFLIQNDRFITQKDIEERQNRAVYCLKHYDPNNPLEAPQIEKAKAVLDSYNIDYSQLLENAPTVEASTVEEVAEMNAAIPDDTILPDIDSSSVPAEPDETVYTESAAFSSSVGNEDSDEPVSITLNDIAVLQSLPPRKSVLNFTAEEIKQTEKWALHFGDIKEKSPFHRAVNGEWRDNEKSKVQIIKVEDTGKDFNSVRDDIKSLRIKRGTINNTDTEWAIQVSRKGLEDSIHYAESHHEPAVFNMLYHIEEIVSNAVLLDTVTSERNNDNKAFNTALMHKLYAICNTSQTPYIAKLSVEEFANGNTGTLKRLYNLQDIKIEPLRHVVFTDERLAQSVLNGTEISISDVFSIVKENDKDFYLNQRPKQEVAQTLSSDEENYKITDLSLGQRPAAEKFRDNLAAIRTLKQLEAEDRQATPEEQETLSKYTGWGGMARVFEPDNKHYSEVRALLTDDEFAAARKSTMTAFYTSPVIIKEMYNKLAEMGFNGGRLLDKSTPRLIQFYTFRNAIKPPFLGGFFVFGTSAA